MFQLYDRTDGAEHEKNYQRLPLAGTRVGEVACEGKPRLFYPEDYEPRTRALLEEMGYLSAVVVPLIARGEVIGVMNVGFYERRPAGLAHHRDAPAVRSMTNAVDLPAEREP